MKRQTIATKSCRQGARLALALLILLISPASLAGNFGVSPIRLDLDRNARTGAITITNDDPEKPLQLQVKAFAWSQDEEGKDRYEESGDLTFFPRIMTLPPQENRLVRAGIRVPAADREKTYRLFIEEIPEPRKVEAQGAQIAVKVRFGVPVFVKPLKEEPRGEIEKIELSRGTVTVKVKNTGNTHFVIKSVNLKSGDLFAKEISGWYLLPGAARAHSAAIPAEVCKKLGKLDVTVKTDRLELSHSLDVDKAMCE